MTPGLPDLLDAYTDLLRTLAVRRQAEVDAATFVTYAQDLARERVALVDLEQACWLIGRTPRAEYQPAFPEIGKILQMCANLRRERQLRAIAIAQGETPKLLTDGKPLTRAEAKNWLERIKAAAHGRSEPTS